MQWQQCSASDYKAIPKESLSVSYWMHIKRRAREVFCSCPWHSLRWCTAPYTGKQVTEFTPLECSDLRAVRVLHSPSTWNPYREGIIQGIIYFVHTFSVQSWQNNNTPDGPLRCWGNQEKSHSAMCLPECHSCLMISASKLKEFFKYQCTFKIPHQTAHFTAF